MVVLSAYVGESDEVPHSRDFENTKSSQSAVSGSAGIRSPAHNRTTLLCPEASLLPRGARRILSAPVRTSQNRMRKMRMSPVHIESSHPHSHRTFFEKDPVLESTHTEI